jgi:hypothetical protein
MGDTNNPTPFIAWGLWRENRKQGAAMEWRELGPVFVHADGSGGFAHLKSIPTSGWNYRINFRRPGDGPPPLPVLRPARKPKPPPEDEEADIIFSGDDAEEQEPSENQE